MKRKKHKGHNKLNMSVEETVNNLYIVNDSTGDNYATYAFGDIEEVLEFIITKVRKED